MLTKDEFFEAIDAHMSAMLEVARHGDISGAMSMAKAILTVTWELSRPEVQRHSVDISGHIPDDMRSIIKSLKLVVITEGENVGMMAWGAGLNHDGNDILKDDEKLTEDQIAAVLEVIDEQMEAHFGHLDTSKVTKMESLAKRDKGPMTTAHVNITKEAIDKAAAEFNDEFDRLFETWGGGES